MKGLRLMLGMFGDWSGRLPGWNGLLLFLGGTTGSNLGVASRCDPDLGTIVGAPDPTTEPLILGILGLLSTEQIFND